MSTSVTNSTAVETNVLTDSNQSVVQINIIISWDGGSWAQDNPRWYMKIDGVTKANGTANFNANENYSGSQSVATRSFTIDHNSDGKKTITWEVGYEGIHSGEGIYSTKSGSLPLTDIVIVTDNTYVKTDNGWKLGKAYVKTNNGWVEGKPLYKTNSGWK